MVIQQARRPLSQRIDQLVAVYGEPPRPTLKAPWELILWETVAYLADDDRRGHAFALLRQRVGTAPDALLAASDEMLVEITRAGIMPEQQAGKLRQAAAIALDEFAGDLDAVRRWPLPRAKRALMQFPGIGEPGAEKILLFSRSAPVLALDSNGLRVLLRLGYGDETKHYAATYRSVQAAVQREMGEGGEVGEAAEEVAELVDAYAWLIRAYQVLRQHGQELCRRAQPRCEVCPLSTDCAYYRAHRRQFSKRLAGGNSNLGALKSTPRRAGTAPR